MRLHEHIRNDDFIGEPGMLSLVARTLMIFRVTPGASRVQSPIAALPVTTVAFSAAAAIMMATTKTAAEKIVWKIASLDGRAFISVESFGRQTSRGFESAAANLCLATAP